MQGMSNGQSSGVLLKEVAAFQGCPLVEGSLHFVSFAHFLAFIISTSTLCTATNKLHLTYGTTILEGGSGGHGHLFIRSSSGYSPICDHTFGMREGDVACRQMGYTRAISVVKNS